MSETEAQDFPNCPSKGQVCVSITASWESCNKHSNSGPEGNRKFVLVQFCKLEICKADYQPDQTLSAGSRDNLFRFFLLALGVAGNPCDRITC